MALTFNKEFVVQYLVGEASATDGNSSKDTVALVLVHDQARLNLKSKK